MARILVAPLDWGLGHATRCIPIIRILKQHGHNVVLAGSGDSLSLLMKSFRNAVFSFACLCAVLAESGSRSWNMLFQLPSLSAIEASTDCRIIRREG